MACEITQASLGPAFSEVDPDLAALIIETATELVLGVGACQLENEAKWIACCLPPCRAIKLLASHILATLPGSGGEAQLVTSESVADVSTSYANAGSSAGIYSGSPYGLLYASLLGKYERCARQRTSLPRSYGPVQGCGC